MKNSIEPIAYSGRKRELGMQRLVRQIADELLTVQCGHSSWEMGDRLAVKKADGFLDRDLGGRNRKSIEEVLKCHLLSNRE